ncbi:D-isomer specific 2-hydroxyacid dehydrogenase [Xylaria bambusicola]|uniref:D-isomer specific 2-hydroxyacid dehydrogenase n=1 Tax=Xylaria bambusicola TaxID=326684 RepID=UPI0020075908|nr:D-isomer specific 2-hydroxyacid dehydrogenase [Xylaria bambusicola]KAI0505914.1 D-isomer specific 2-hydroxyacid dehydrogenase [Xylaria bambusicola]
MDALKVPDQLPSLDHEVIVLLEEVHFTVDAVDTTPRSHEILAYHRISKAEEIRERIQCASIVIATQSCITAESLGEAPYLKCIITPSAGINHIDLEECKRRGIKVAKCPGSTSPAAAEHALSLYFAARRKTVMLHNDIRTVDENRANLWKRQHSLALKMQTANERPPCSLEEEVAGIIGYGHIGKRLETLCTALGMKVVIAGRKYRAPDKNATTDQMPARTPFGEVMRTATVLFICCTSNSDTQNLIDAAELSAMRPEVIMVNISRGGVINTQEVVKALRERRISGAAADVFDQEPASTEGDSAFLAEDTKDLNLTFSPHVGYFSTKTMVIMKDMVRERIKWFVDGDFSKFEV